VLRYTFDLSMSINRCLIICPYPRGRAANQRFRFEQYLSGLNHEINQVSFWNANEWPALYSSIPLWKKVLYTAKAFLRRFFCLFTLFEYDLIFIHREATPVGPPWFEWVAAVVFKKQIVYDFDDAIWLPNSSSENAKFVGGLKNHGKVGKICSWSKTVVVGNQFLANYASQFCLDVRVIPTTIDTKNLHNSNLLKANSNNTQLQTIGWTGTHSTIKQLLPLFPLLEKINKTHPFRFLIIADIPPENMSVFMEFRKWNKDSEILDLIEFDLGIMPLFDTEWEYGKCGFKALQYMALEIPAIVSAVGVNIEIVQDGVQGFVVDPMPIKDETAWTNAIITLLEDDKLRTEMGKKGRSRIEEAYSLNSQLEAYRQIFDPLL